MGLSVRRVLFSALVAVVVAHPDIADPVLYKREQLEIRKLVEKKCGPEIHQHRAARMAKRAEIEGRGDPSDCDSVVLLTPETTQGPYHIRNEVVRQDVTAGQRGIPLDLEIEFLDFSTCKPVQVWVDLWNANATGHYSGWANASMDLGGGGAAPAGPTNEFGLSPNFAPSDLEGLPVQAGMDPENITVSHSIDSLNWLRGVWRSDEFGHFSFKTILPGWYFGRAPHIHFKVYQDGHIAENGTFISGMAQHTGQFFIPADLMDRIAEMSPYSANTVNRTTNDEDGVYPYETLNDHNPNLDIVHKNMRNAADGLIGYSLVALNLSWVSPEISDSYASSTGSAHPTGLPGSFPPGHPGHPPSV